ncbi:MAG TPA: hypothetical protein VFO39_00385 [Candidatus Sulfotelmatobacter sp.]|nr:hypothetical protein [Candidatus Sulfotelmatobacter sp.]
MPGGMHVISGKRQIGTYVLLGFVLPWIIIVIAALRYRRFDELSAFPSHLFGSGYNYALVGCLNAIPFIVVAVAAFVHSKIKRRSMARKLGIRVGAVVVVLVSLVYQSLAWSNLMGPRPDALTGIAFLFLPWVATSAFLFSAAFTWLLGALWLRVRGHES